MSDIVSMMGFALWLHDDVAWAQGTHEYKPMGAAVVGLGSLFRARDFSNRRRAPRRGLDGYAGMYASLEDLNRQLAKSESQRSKKNRRKRDHRVIATF